MKDVRKVFKSGKGSYILTLPKRWILENGLKDGDSVYLEIKSNKLLSPPPISRRDRVRSEQSTVKI